MSVNVIFLHAKKTIFVERACVLVFHHIGEYTSLDLFCFVNLTSSCSLTPQIMQSRQIPWCYGSYMYWPIWTEPKGSETEWGQVRLCTINERHQMCSTQQQKRESSAITTTWHASIYIYIYRWIDRCVCVCTCVCTYIYIRQGHILKDSLWNLVLVDKLWRSLR